LRVTLRQAVARIAAYGLPDREGTVLDEGEAPLDPATWSHVVAVVGAQRLTGFLQAAVSDGALPVTADQRRTVDELHLAACAAMLWLEQRLLEVAAYLESADVPFVVLKGAALAHLAYEDPGLRSFGDNDLLIPPDRYPRALHLLREQGYQRSVLPTSEAFDRRFGKGATLCGRAGDEVDLHRTLVFGTVGLIIDVDDLFETAVPFELGGRELNALGPEARLLHAAYHAALGDPTPRYASVRDVAQLLLKGEHDPAEVLGLARRWRSTSVLARAVGLCRSVLGVDVGGPVAEALAGRVPTPRERRMLASYVGPRRSFAAKVLASLSYLDTAQERRELLVSAALPSRAFVQQRAGGARGAWLRRGLRSLLRHGRRS
jgi:hypothetical protein